VEDGELERLRNLLLEAIELCDRLDLKIPGAHIQLGHDLVTRPFDTSRLREEPTPWGG
jgi:hypothetical protein